ncbi:MAG: AbrB/MazE/SpoVT family DNA-binding domain-containing protein [Spirochaetota bacterium]
MSNIAKVQRNYQITLPASIRKKINIKEGDLINFEIKDNGILIKPVETIDRNQAWFWSKRWQDEEKKVEKDFEKGKIKVSENLENFLDELNK